jgi:predicted O-methyltransferase YrrM
MIAIDWRSCESMAEEHEQIRAEHWVRTYFEELGRELKILEIGSFKGQSTAMLAQFGQVLAVDLWGNVDFGPKYYDEIGTHHYLSFIGNMTRLKLIDRVFPITSTSSVLEFLPNMALDVVFIDAGHFYEDVKKDIEMSLPHVGSKSLMIFDDYMRPGFGYPPFDPNHPHHGPVDPWIGVKQAVDELLTKGDFEIVEHYYGKICLRRK